MKDKLSIRIISKKSPARFVAFDAPMIVEPLNERRAELCEREFDKKHSWFEVIEQYPAFEFPRLWEAVLDNQREGLIFKRLNSAYHEGKRVEWMKLKAFVEKTALFTKFEEHPRGVTIETDDGRRVVVNGVQAAEIRQQFKDKGAVLAEIQYLPQKNSDAWRFPSFRGVVK